jgi:replication factor C subunit 3/5
MRCLHQNQHEMERTMNFENRNMPKSINDLVIKEEAIAAIIKDYASGLRQKHLLLHGPAGSGKSIAARLIVATRLDGIMDASIASFHPEQFKHTDLSPIEDVWAMQHALGAAHGYAVIDEVDFFKEGMLRKLRALTDGNRLGTVIATTNNLHKLDDPLQNRFNKVHVELPMQHDWAARAQEILAAEGLVLTNAQVTTLLNGFQGSARDMIEWLEDYEIKFKRIASAMPIGSPAVFHFSDAAQTNGTPLQRKH